MSTQTDDFLPQGYEVPKSDSSYLKLVGGDNKFRILSKPIIGWVDWKDKKPYRFPMDKKPAAPFSPTQDIRHFWAFVVWDYTAKRISIFELTIKGIQNAIAGLQANPDWGSPLNYDITINKVGTTMADTKYTTVPSPPKPVHAKIAELYAETPIKLEALFDGKDPFDVNKPAPDTNHSSPAEITSAPDGDDLPF